MLDGRTPAVEDVPKLEYTRAVVAESMRLYPPAWTMGRRAIEPHTIDGHIIEPGALVIVSQWIVHHDPRWWHEPNAFRPNGGSTTGPGAGSRTAARPARPKYAYFPFGGGSRICIGESFAWTEAILLLATIAQQWRFVAGRAPPRAADHAPTERSPYAGRAAIDRRYGAITCRAEPLHLLELRAALQQQQIDAGRLELADALGTCSGVPTSPERRPRFDTE